MKGFLHSLSTRLKIIFCKIEEDEVVSSETEDDIFEPATTGSLIITPKTLYFTKVVDILNKELFEIEMIRFIRIENNKKEELRKNAFSEEDTSLLADDVEWIKSTIKSKRFGYYIHAEKELKNESRFVVNLIYEVKPQLKELNYHISKIWLTHQDTELLRIKNYFDALRAETMTIFASRNLVECFDESDSYSTKSGSGTMSVKNKNKFPKV